MKISVYNLYIYEELNKALDIYKASLNNSSKDKKDVLFEFFQTEQTKKAYQKGIRRYYNDFRELIDSDFPEKEKFYEITASDIEEIPKFISTKEMQFEFEETDKFIKDNKDVFMGTEFLIGKNSDKENTVKNHELQNIQQNNQNVVTEFKKEEKRETIKQPEQTIDLQTIYQKFISSSFFQNVLQAEETLSAQYAGDPKKIKEIFYQSINAADQIKTVAALRHIFSTSVIDFFKNDSRYQDFLQKYLSGRNQVERDNFLKNSLQKKYILLFIRLILEKKLKINNEQSAMIGVGLAILAGKSNQNDFADIAFGDEAQNKFAWQNI